VVKAFLALCLVLPAAVAAGSLDSLSVTRDGKHYSVTMVASLEATQQQVWAVLADPEALRKLNDAIVEIDYSESPNKAATRRAVSVIRLCVLFFCKHLNQTQDLFQEPNHLRAEVIPALSDFHQGYGDWKVGSFNGAAQLTFVAGLEPKFWIPPLIGPWVIRRKMANEAQVTMNNIENLAKGLMPRQ
jgi:hypothetical protein